MKNVWYWLVAVVGLVVAVLLRRKPNVNRVEAKVDWDKKADEVRTDIRSEDLVDEARKPVEVPEALRQSGEWRIE